MGTIVEYENTDDFPMFPGDAAASSYSVNLSSKNFIKVISPSAGPLISNYFQNLWSNMPFSEQVSASSQQQTILCAMNVHQSFQFL